MVTMEPADEGTPIAADDGEGSFDYNAYNFEFSEKTIRMGNVLKSY